MSSSQLTIQLFGPMRVLIAGEPMPRVRSRSVEWLLALLVLRHGRVVDRSWLAGTLWLDSDEASAMQNLRHSLVHLRKALGSESARIQSPSRDTLTLALEEAEVDVLAFDRMVAARDEESLRDAVALYTGPLLEGCYEMWVTPERESREQACLNALETLADRAEERGDYGEAVALLRRAEGMDGLRDSIQRRLMRVLAASGDRPLAMMGYREYRLRLRQEMNVEPDAETTRLFQQLRATSKTTSENQRYPKIPREHEARSNALPATSELRNPLPHSLTALIGREEATREVVRLVSASRLVTLVGTGGVGKTRLAIQVAAEAEEDFPHGAVFVALASLSDPALLAAFVASSVGMRAEGTAEAGTLLKMLGDWFSMHPMLLVLDNCEHLIEATAQLGQALLEQCPRLHILATSRQRLGLTGEVVWRVPSLPCPDPQNLPANAQSAADYARQYPAVQLFVERVAQVRPEFQWTALEDIQAAARICHRLDGIPLALELAAARTQALSLPQIALRLDDRFRLLVGGSRTALPRQQTLRALIEWSYELLSEPERGLLCRLSVFTGGWTLEAAEYVDTGDALGLLASLVEKSLVLAEDLPAGRRYRMLETVREYAQERLRESGGEAMARQAHLDYFLRLAQETGPALRGADLEAALERVEAEVGNFRDALQWAQTNTASSDASLRLSAALWPFWEVRGHHTEGREHLRAALTRPGGLADTPERAQALLGAATLAFVQADWVAVLSSGRESVHLFHRLEDSRGLAAGLLLLGYASGKIGELAASRALLTEALARARECGWDQGTILAFSYLGVTADLEGDLAQARSFWEQSVALAEATGDVRALALSLHYTGRILGHLALKTGDDVRLHTLLERSLQQWRRLGDTHKAALTLCILGDVSRWRQGDPVLACAYYEEAIEAWRDQGNRNRLAAALHEMGNALFEQGEYERARSAYAESLVLFDQLEEDYGRDFVRVNLGNTLFHLGEPVAARHLFREALPIYQQKAVAEGMVWTLERLAVVEAMYGDAGPAVRLLGAASTARRALGIPLSRSDQADWEQALVSVRGALEAQDFTSLWAEGSAWTLEQAVAYALRTA